MKRVWWVQSKHGVLEESLVPARGSPRFLGLGRTRLGIGRTTDGVEGRTVRLQSYGWGEAGGTLDKRPLVRH